MVNCGDLQRIIDKQAIVIKKLGKQLNELESRFKLLETNMADAMEEKADAILLAKFGNLKHTLDTIDRKVDDTKLELSTVIKTTSSTTVNVVSGFFDKLDSRVTELVSDTNIKFDVVEKQWIADIKADVDAIEARTKSYRASLNEFSSSTSTQSI